ncbi:hypothetical protein [Streptomyces tsukubensis]|uniref:Uncharacterized protein n=1 Tax=Streptomyces tsukubensis (strain DSM 42081 / NBRC 108919 / NRRL 18488 / 9993) TaxID=1114943 RepID=A0A7G3UBJ9_STRT9|nr:hypothetical protein [Streptomyces tsukubensis]AZK96227.1 hypothetical protein B7R87_21920 [Streptomyces tsukubensis]QKM67763.1 hypothetical protein STSU_011870 [Streptomyces tsukubensis NRRL18488]QWA14221.1 hypothetical protein [Streptomyces tsukubensis]TAI44159.1 hypothetical protein EWI31_11665 [Streptomyces tsukubensis]
MGPGRAMAMAVSADSGGRPQRASAPGFVRKAAALLLCAAVSVSAQAPAAADTRADGAGEAYETARDARPVTGATAGEGPLLPPGTYTDDISAGERKTYRIRLDGTSNAYVSAVLAPPPGTRVTASEGIRITLKSPGGVACSDGTDITFGSMVARPVADYATRRIGPGRACQEAGVYEYAVEGIGPGGGPDATAADGGSGARDLPTELRFMLEPGLRDGEDIPAPAGSYDQGTSALPSGTARTTSGGSGFNDAPATGHGVWRDELAPGETRFYRMPVDWGQQLLLDASLGGRTSGDGLRMTVFNPARGFVVDADAARPGRALALATAPVAFGNRTSGRNETGAMRFSGWYFVRLTRDRDSGGTGAAERVALRVAVTGAARPAPPYAGDPVAAGFGVTAADRRAAGTGLTARESDRRDTLRTVAFTAFGLGTALLIGLVAWTVLLRRSLARTAPGPSPWN